MFYFCRESLRGKVCLKSRLRHHLARQNRPAALLPVGNGGNSDQSLPEACDSNGYMLPVSERPASSEPYSYAYDHMPGLFRSLVERLIESPLETAPSETCNIELHSHPTVSARDRLYSEVVASSSTL